jgi:N-acetylglucosamine repressor
MTRKASKIETTFMQLYPTSETPTDIRRRNRFAVLSLLRHYGTLSKSELVRLTDRTVTTIAAILEELLGEGLVALVEEQSGETARGRPASFYRLNGHRWIVAGIQITSDTATAVILNLNGQVMSTASIGAPSDLPGEGVLALSTDLLRTLIEPALDEGMRLLGIGIALEGIVDIMAGLSLWMLFRNKWRDVPVVAHFERQFNVPILLDYRVFAAALAEAVYGAARGESDFAYLNVDTGIAVAAIASGRLVRGRIGPTGVTGGLGHVLTSGGSRLCYCGKTGCLHTEITTQALLMQLKEILDVSQGSGLGQFWQTHEPRLDNLISAAQQGDELALQLRSRFAEGLGIAASGAAQLFSAKTIIIGGAAIKFGGEEALEVARRAVQRLTILHSQFGLTKIVATNLLPDPATVGAATLIIQAVMNGQISIPHEQLSR